MPSPIETLFLAQASPVPTQTMFGFDVSIVTAPMDCDGWRSKTGLKVVPPLTDFHTPPLAAPTNTVIRPSFWIASTEAMRPLMVAEPMLRIGSPDMVAASNLIACWADAQVGSRHPNARKHAKNLSSSGNRRTQAAIIKSPLCIHPENLGRIRYFLGCWFFRDAGTAKSALSSGTLTSILSMVLVCHEVGSFFGPEATEYGYITPATGL